MPDRTESRDSLGFMISPVRRDLLIWMLFLVICLGLGYPTLNRYDPRTAGGTTDSVSYYPVVVDGRGPSQYHLYYRVLVPYLARPFYKIAQGHTGSWNPVFFGMLISNSFFTATTAYLLVAAARLWKDSYTSLLGGILYLLTFDVANAKLSGMVDSGEGCLLMALVWILATRRFRLLPVCGAVGALAKETFVPISAVLALTWWFSEWRRKPKEARVEQLAWIAAMGASAFAAVTVLHSVLDGRIVWPWQPAAVLNTHRPIAFLATFADRNLLYEFAWLLPLGLIRLRDQPRSWVLACTAATVTVLCLDLYFHGAQGALGRATHSVAGPLLSLSAADFLVQCLSPKSADMVA
jgi:hypothetical protein